MMESRPLLARPDDTPGVLRHIARLSGYLPGEGQRIGYVRVYATLREPVAPGVAEPPLEVYPATDQGFEGIACVDDVARAATLALQVYEMTASESAFWPCR